MTSIDTPVSRREFVGALAFGSTASTVFAQASHNTPLILSIDGPLIVTSDLSRQRDLFEGVFGMTLVADQNLDEQTVMAVFGVAQPARTILLATPSASPSVRLVEFAKPSHIAVREGMAAIDADALKVIDFMVPDMARAIAAVEARGFKLVAAPTQYSVPPDGKFTEGHLEGPDHITCALLQMHDTPMTKYVGVTDRTFSEMLGFSAPVSDRDAAISFYRDVLGLDEVLSYEIATDGFQKMLGSKEKTLLRGANFGINEPQGSPRVTKQPMLGVIHYGLPPRAFRSLRSRAVLPNRGLQALRFKVASAERIAARAREQRVEIVAPQASATLFPEGQIRSVLLRAPHGVLHQFVEVVKT